jgi:2-amino-4-hydroxy-6-hydroxymethyldihydropteridine diphosphokinase/dihydropteroate synthase
MEPLWPLKTSRNTHIMGILNLSPESFSDGDMESSKAANMHRYTTAGVRILDVGGQSSAPGASDISEHEELSRIIPVITYLNKMKTSPEWDEFAISVDTYRAFVAQAAVEAGADIINDISGGQMDSDMLPTMARLGKTVCLMHMRGTPSTMNSLTNYPGGLIPTIAEELLGRVTAAEEAGIRRWRIILDPGIGFAKTSRDNIEILRRLDELREWPGLRGMPWLVGPSRKGFIGKVTGVEKPYLRDWGTAATVAAAVQGGADIVRVHRMYDMLDVARMSDAIWRR